MSVLGSSVDLTKILVYKEDRCLMNENDNFVKA